LLVACGKERHWPAEITSCENCTQEETDLVFSSVEELNSKSGSNLVALKKDSAETKFAIKLFFVDSVALQESSESKNTRAGLATVYPDRCEVQLSRDLHKAENSHYFKAVLWHEMGHCAGLDHDKNEEDLMFSVTKKFQAYTDETLIRFFNKFKQSAGL